MGYEKIKTEHAGAKNGQWASNLLIQLQYTPNCRSEYPLFAAPIRAATVRERYQRLAAAGAEFHRVENPQSQQDCAPPDAGVKFRVDHGMRGRVPELIQTGAGDQNAIHQQQGADEEPDGEH